MLQDWQSLFSQASHGLIAPLSLPGDASSRIYWLFWLSSAMLAAAVLYFQPGKRSRAKWWRRLRATLFNPRGWWHRSTLIDVSLLAGNSALRAAIIIPLLGSHLAVALLVARALQGNFGNSPDWQWPWWCIASAYTLTFFLVEDFSRFTLHKAMHQVPLLWRFHRLHHSAETLTPLTLFRVHPLEMTLYYLRGLLVFGVVTGCFVYFFRGRLSGLDILGVDMLGFLFNFFGANLRHSHIWFSFGRGEKWFISPAQHQLHHSRALEHRNKNFGSALAIWDRLFGSFVAAGHQRQRIRFGVLPSEKINQTDKLSEATLNYRHPPLRVQSCPPQLEPCARQTSLSPIDSSLDLRRRC